MKLLIDPGHGLPADPGATGNGLVESELVLGLALQLREVLAATGWPIDLHLTRAEDNRVRKLELSERGRIERAFGADLVLSIHANTNAAPEVGGLMSYYFPGSKVGQEVADVIDAASPMALRKKGPCLAATREDWPRVRNVLQSFQAPAVLVEVGFLSHAEDARHLADPRIQRELVAALLTGIARSITLLEPKTA